MEKKIYCCDVCGKEYISEMSIFKIFIDHAEDSGEYHVRDICYPCFNKICDYVENLREESGYNNYGKSDC